jgi:hypothetical protein
VLTNEQAAFWLIMVGAAAVVWFSVSVAFGILDRVIHACWDKWEGGDDGPRDLDIGGRGDGDGPPSRG